MKNTAEFPYESITPFTLLDFPETTACILWFAGCNMRCQYCYNPEIVFGNGKLSHESVLSFLKKRKGLLDGVVLSGGECTTHPHLVSIIESVKELGFKVKIDTNGSMPWVLEKILDLGLVDYVALDIKSTRANYTKVTHSKLFGRVERSLEILLLSGCPFELRTTFHSDLFSAGDLEEIYRWLAVKGFEGPLYIQQYVGEKAVIGELGDNRKLTIADLDAIPGNFVLRN